MACKLFHFKDFVLQRGALKELSLMIKLTLSQITSSQTTWKLGVIQLNYQMELHFWGATSWACRCQHCSTTFITSQKNFLLNRSLVISWLCQLNVFLIFVVASFNCLFMHFFFWKNQTCQAFWDYILFPEFLKITNIITLSFKFENIDVWKNNTNVSFKFFSCYIWFWRTIF